MDSKKLLLCFLLVAVGIICLMAGLSSAFQRTELYYVQVDNAYMAEVSPRNGGMDHTYTLPAYNDKGEAKEISFDTNRELREEAYLCLKYNRMRGVISWAEVQEDVVPQAALEGLKKLGNK